MKNNKSLEGGLFVNIFTIPQFGNKKQGYKKDYYTVENGKKYDSGDTLESIQNECKRVGDYDSTLKYKMKICMNRRKLKYNVELVKE
jgi:hypothetical protein